MNKKVLFLPILGSFLLSGCKFNLFGKPIYLFEKKPDPETNTVEIPDVTPDEMHKHATSLSYASGSPNAPFYLKVGEAKNLGVSLSPAPDLDEEKTISWKLEGDEFVSYTVNETSSNKVTIEGKKAGTATLVATNDYNKNLTYKFNIKVIDFDAENEYLWQYKTSDRAQFGYESEDGKKAGTTEGDANLGGVTWHYTRSKATSLQSSMGGVGFGKNEEPETHIHFETENNRIVKSFKIEAASAKSLAKMTVKVGDTTYLDKVSVPADYYDVIGTINSDPNITPDSGKIQIDIDTPEYDYTTAASDPTYVTPGAFYLKSFYFTYESETIASIKVAEDSKHKINYVVGEEFSIDGLSLKKVSERGYEFDVDVAKEIEAENLTYVVEDMSEASHEAKKVTLTLKVDGYETPFTCEYDIHVREANWVPNKIEILGSVEPQSLIEGDKVDYSGLSIKVIYDEEHDDSYVVPFAPSSSLSFSYDSTKNPFVALKAMEEGYEILVEGHFVSPDGTVTSEDVSATFVVSANVLTIEESIFDLIDYSTNEYYSEVPGLAASGKAISYATGEDDRLTISYMMVASGARVSDGVSIPKSKSTFDIKLTDKNLSIDKLVIEFAQVNAKTNSYSVHSSVYGGAPFGEEIAHVTNHKLEVEKFDSKTNALHFVNSNDEYYGISSILIRYSETPQLVYGISYEGELEKSSYNEGDLFDPTGLNVYVSEVGSNDRVEVTQFVEWFDGSTYETAPQKTLSPESTYVVGVFGEVHFTVNIEEVAPKVISLELVTDSTSIVATEKYYIVGEAKNKDGQVTGTYLSLGTSGKDKHTGKGALNVSSEAFGATASLNILNSEDYYQISKDENDLFNLKTTTDYYWGLGSGGNISTAASPQEKGFAITINENGYAEIKIEMTVENATVTKYLSFSGTLFNLVESSKNNGNVKIYKVVA